MNSNITDISYVYNLTNLEELNLRKNNISDISGLANLTNLKSLALDNNNITDISPLANLTSLESLLLNETNIDDISALSSLSNLRVLQLEDTSLSSLAPLSGLTNLEWLVASSNNLTSLTGLENLTKLTSAHLSNNNISDISALANLTNLDYLLLDINNISDISALANLTNLRRLVAFDNNIVDISPLKNMDKLEYLNLGDNKIIDISSLSNLQELEELYLANNNIANISTLTNLSSLMEVAIEGNNINFLDTTQSTALQKLLSGNLTIHYDTPSELVFDDVLTTAWYYDSVMNVYELGIMGGMSETSFGPTQTTTKAMMMAMLHRIDGNQEVNFDTGFSDIQEGAWYTSSINWAVASGVYEGFPASSTFEPNENITREQLALIMYNYANYSGQDTSKAGNISEFTDANDISSWTKDAIVWAVGAGIVNGKGNGNLDPTGTATRAEIATIMTRFLELTN